MKWTGDLTNYKFPEVSIEIHLGGVLEYYCLWSDMNNNFVYPKYDGESILNIPSTVLSLFNLPPIKETLPENYFENILGVEKVVLFLIDGLGFNLFEKEALKYPFFKKLAEKNMVKKITSIFPSSTPPAVNTLNSGLSPLEHGLIEWFLYLRELDCIVESLPFKAAISKDQEKLLNPPEGILFNAKTIYEMLAKAEIPSFTFCYRGYADSFYNQTSFSGSRIKGYNTIADFLVALRDKITETSHKAYFYAYWPAVDSAEHEFGPDSVEAKTEISLLSYMLQKEFIDQIDQKTAEKTAIIFTADHGQVRANLKKTIYLNDIAGLSDVFKKSNQGRPILPSGSARDVYLNILDDKLDWALELLKKELEGKAQVMTIKKALEMGLFGEGKMHPEFLNRVGNLLILPYDNNTVWYAYEPERRVGLIGQHGGLTEDEMFVPFIATRISELKD